MGTRSQRIRETAVFGLRKMLADAIYEFQALKARLQDEQKRAAAPAFCPLLSVRLRRTAVAEYAAPVPWHPVGQIWQL